MRKNSGTRSSTFRVQIGNGRLALFKVALAEMRFISRLLKNGEMTSDVAAREVERVQSKLYGLAQPKESN